MALKDILVHIDNTEACQSRLNAAIQLAQQHRAHLTGLFVISPVIMPGYVAVEVPIANLEAHERAQKELAEDAHTHFIEEASKHGIECEWRCEEGDFLNIIHHNARYADLIILGQSNPEDAYFNNDFLPEDIILKCGRPVMITPYIGIPETLNNNIMVAWNGSRESIRAVNDAIPLLQAANRVTVVSITEHAGGHNNLNDSDIVRHLIRHDINAHAIAINQGDLSIGNALLSYAADENFDLLVMGAYGHSRLREWILGGATRQLLDETTLPVLLSH